MSAEYHAAFDPPACFAEGHDPFCAGRAGGEHTYRDCFVCRDSLERIPFVGVVIDGVTRDVCDTCVERADEGDDLIEHLNREGMPEFNGAFR